MISVWIYYFSHISLVFKGIMLLASVLIRLALQNNAYRQLAPKVMIKTSGFSNAIWTIFPCTIILLSDYNPLTGHKTYLTQALNNHDSFLCKEEIFVLGKNNRT